MGCFGSKAKKDKDSGPVYDDPDAASVRGIHPDAAGTAPATKKAKSTPAASSSTVTPFDAQPCTTKPGSAWKDFTPEQGDDWVKVEKKHHELVFGKVSAVADTFARTHTQTHKTHAVSLRSICASFRSALPSTMRAQRRSQQRYDRWCCTHRRVIIDRIGTCRLPIRRLAACLLASLLASVRYSFDRPFKGITISADGDRIKVSGDVASGKVPASSGGGVWVVD